VSRVACNRRTDCRQASFCYTGKPHEFASHAYCGEPTKCHDILPYEDGGAMVYCVPVDDAGPDTTEAHA